jgi:tetratricopeptide (TPR) repeat protein
MPEVWGRIPERNRNFTGRTEVLEQLHHQAHSTDITALVATTAPGASPTALQGMGGVGKTQVAIEYAWRYRNEYDLVWWIPADQSVLVRSSLAALAPRLGLPAPTATGIEEAAAAVLEALRRGEPYKRWLLIFDNADQPEDISSIIPRGPGHVVITSRNHRWQGVFDTVAIDVFDRAESIAFISKRVHKGVNADEADRLARELGDLPLALEQAAALLAETGMSIEQYMRLLKEHVTQLLAEGKPPEYPVSMTAAWSLSVSQLKEKLPEAIELLRCCAFFGPEPIPRDVFVPLSPAEADQPSEADGHVQVTLDPRLASLLDDPILLSTAIRELGRYALTRIDSTSRTIQIHRLVQALLRDELDRDDQVRIRHSVHMLLANAAPRRPDDPLNWPTYGDLLAHAEPSRVVECPNPEVRRFCLDLIRYLLASGDARSALPFAREVIEEWQGRFAGEHRGYVLEAYRHLGIVLRELGEYPAASDVNERTLQEMTTLLGPEDPQTLQLTNSRGADLRAMGNFKTALGHDEESLKRHEQAFGPADPRTLRAANNLALDYVLISDYETALDWQKKTFQQQRSSGSGASAENILSSWDNLARLVRLRGSYPEALDLGEEALAFGVAQLGIEHPWTLRTAKDVSIARRMSGSVEEGLEQAEEAHTRWLRVRGPGNPDTLAAAMNLANARRMNGQTDEGYELARDTMERYPQVYGDDHPYNHGCAVNLALLLRARGEMGEAYEIDKWSHDRLMVRIGPDHHFTLTCGLNLATDLAELRRTQEARALEEDALPRLEKLLGKNHPLTIACSANLVQDLRAEGAGEEADRMGVDTLARYESTLGFDHPDTEAFRSNRRLEFDIDPPPI